MGGPCRCCLRQEMRSIERWNGRSWKVGKLKSWRVKGFLDSLLTLQLLDYRDRLLNLAGKALYDCGELHIGGGVGGTGLRGEPIDARARPSNPHQVKLGWGKDQESTSR